MIKMMQVIKGGLLFLIFCQLIPVASLAHVKSQSFSQWEAQENKIHFSFIIDLRRITQLARLYEKETEYKTLFSRHLRKTLKVTQKTSCLMEQLEIRAHVKGKLRASGYFVCPQTIRTTQTLIFIGSFYEVSSTHIHYVRIKSEGGLTDIVLNKARRSFIYQNTLITQSLSSFGEIGFWHVLSGFDHILFLLVLILLATTPRLAIWSITGFTLGHSLTLGIVSLGLLKPDMALIESMIGLTIATAAMQVAQQNQRPFMTPVQLTAFVLSVFIMAGILGKFYLLAGFGLSLFVYTQSRLETKTQQAFLPFITACFGLIHGAGFAEGLLTLNYNKSTLFKPMLGFNLGVEAAQLLTLAVFYCLIIGARKLFSATTMKQFQLSQSALVLGIFGIGFYWFASRLWS